MKPVLDKTRKKQLRSLLKYILFEDYIKIKRQLHNDIRAVFKSWGYYNSRIYSSMSGNTLIGKIRVDVGVGDVREVGFIVAWRETIRSFATPSNNREDGGP
jgi:hypothetical protein